MNVHFDSFRETKKMIDLNLDDPLQSQYWLWQEKTRVNCHVDGDRSTRYFHRTPKIKKISPKVMSSIRVREYFLNEPQ